MQQTPTGITPKVSASLSRSPSLDVSTGMNGSNGYSDLGHAELLTGKLGLHAELIKALQDFTAQSITEGLFESSGAMSRETVLEQALVEQNHILDVMQELIATLESENKQSREKINKQGRIMSGLEVKLRQNEKVIVELKTRSNTFSQQGNTSAIADLKRQLNSKEQAIAALQTKLSRESESMLSAKLAAANTKLEVERVRCIELEEEMVQMKFSLSQLNREIEEKNSKIFKSESDISHWTHEVESMRKFEQQQQELVADQRGTLSNKDMQIRSLTRALNKEKKVADQLRRIQVGTSGLAPSPKLGNPESQYTQPNLFEQLAGRSMFSFELTRITPESELGFSFAKVGSGRNQSLIVKNVREGSMAGDFLRIGDELLEVNGLQCRSFQQLRAVNALEKGSGILRIVIARAPDYSAGNNKMFHSTPNKLTDTQSADEANSVWSDNLLAPNTTFQNFSGSMDELHSMDAIFVVVPESVSQSTTPNTSSDQLPNDNERTEENANYQDMEEKPRSGTPLSTSSVHETESLVTLSSREEVSVKKLQYEVADLQDQLDESERLRIEFESTLDTTSKDLVHTKDDNETIRSENSELNQLLLARDKEINEIRQYVSELQSSLVMLQSQVVDDQQKIGSLENQNRNLSAELRETRTNSKEDIQLKENFRDTIKNLKLELEQSRELSADLEAKFEDQKLEKAHLASAAAHMENSLQSLQDSAETSKHKSEIALSAVKQEYQILQSRLEEVTEVSDKAKAVSQEQYEHLNEQLKSARSLLAESELKYTQKQVELRYHKQAADQANKELEGLEPEHRKLVDELRFYKQEAERKTLEIESMSVSWKSVQSKLDGKQQMTTRLQSEVDTLRRTNSNLKNEAVRQREKAKEMEISLKASKGEEIKLGEKLRASGEEKDDLFVQLEKSFEESSELALTMDKLKAEMEELKKQDVTHSKDAIEEMVQSSKLAEAQLKRELESCQKKVELLSFQITELKNQAKTNQSNTEAITAELRKEKSEKLTLEAAKEEMAKELAELLEKNSCLYSESESKLQELEEVNSTLAQLREQLKLEEDHTATYLAKFTEMGLEFEQVKSDYQKTKVTMSSLEFIQKQQEEKLELANTTILEKEKVIKLKNEEIEGVNDRFKKNATDNTAMAKNLASLKQQLKQSQLTHEENLKRLQVELSSKDKMLVSVNNDLKSQHSKEDILTARIESLSGSLAKVTKEKKSLEDDTEVGAKRIEELQSHDNQLTTHVVRLKGELSNANESNNLLSSEVATLRHQLRQNEKEVDQLLAQMNAAEINLEVCQKSLSESEKRSSSRDERMKDLETQYEEECSKTKELSVKVSSGSLDICSRDEEISKLKTTLDLRQQDSAALQRSLVAVQTEFEESKNQIDNLHAECEQLRLHLEESNKRKRACEKSIQELEHSVSDQEKLREKESESHQIEVKSLKDVEEELYHKLEKLEQKKQELETARNELEHSQAELKDSVNKVGNEKDLEIVKLQEDVTAAAKKYREVEEERDALIQGDTISQDSIQKLKADVTKLLEELEEERNISNTLRDEIKVHRETSQDIQGLNESVSYLSNNVKEKSERLIKLEHSLSTSESKVKSLKTENEALLEKLSELALLKHMAAEQSEVIAESKRKLEKVSTEYKQVMKERDQFLATVRELEVKHYQTVPSPTKATPKVSAGENDVYKLQQLLDEREDEIIRTRKFTEELLINVMMKAPFLLEK